MSLMPIDEAKRKVQDFERDAAPRIREMNRLLTIYVALSRRAGLPAEIMDVIAKVQQARIAIDMLTRSIQLFYATSGPIGWLLLIGGLGISGFMLADTFALRRPEY